MVVVENYTLCDKNATNSSDVNGINQGVIHVEGVFAGCRDGKHADPVHEGWSRAAGTFVATCRS